jgi:hypothetical protein
LHVDRPALAVARRLDFERKKLTDPGASPIRLKGGDMDKDRVATPQRRDEPEAAVIVPLFQLAFESHQPRHLLVVQG